MENRKIKGAYLIDPSVHRGTASLGVISKVHSQIDAFRKAGFEVREYPGSNDMSIKGKIARRIPFTNSIDGWNYTYRFDDLDFVYFRKPISMNFAFRKYMKWIKKQNPRIKLVMELPTYPYDHELTKYFRDRPLYWADKIGRRFLNYKIDRIATLTDDKIIFGIPTIHYKNGFDFSTLELGQHRYDPERLDLCCVANFTYWHGYGRLLKGLSTYYRRGGGRQIVIHMVGGGEDYTNLVNLSKDLDLSEKVIFYGKKQRKEIAPIYNKCDIGIGSLATEGYLCALKLREYMAAGLPIIVASRTDVGDEENLKKFVRMIHNSEVEVDFEEIITFFDGLMDEYHGNANKMAEEIRHNVEETFNMDSAMKEVTDYIKGAS